MKTELTISTDAIDESALAKRREMSGGMGAVVCFMGGARGSGVAGVGRRGPDPWGAI